MGAIQLKHLNRFATTCLMLPGNRAAIVDGIDGDITTIDLRTGQSVVRHLIHPEIARIRERARLERTEGVLTIIAATVDSEGSIYCMLGGFKPQDGAPIIVLNPQGEIKSQVRCPIIRGRNGPIVPEAIAVTNGRVFLADRIGQIFVYYLM